VLIITVKEKHQHLDLTLNNLIQQIRKQLDNASSSLRTYIRLLSYSKPYLHLSALILIISIFSSLLSILPTQIMGVAIDEIRLVDRFKSSADETKNSIPAPSDSRPNVVPQPEKSLPIAPAIRKAADYVSANWLPDRNPFIVTFYVLTAAYLLLFLTGTGMSVIHGFIMTRLGQTLIYDMRNHIYSHIQKLSLRYFEDRKTGDIMSRVINDVNSLESVMVGPVIHFITDMLSLIWILYFLLSWDWHLTVLSLLIGPLLIPATIAFGIIMRRNFRILRQKVGELNALLQDNLSGIRIIKGFAREEYEFDRFKGKNEENRRLNIRIGRLSAVFSPSIGVLMQAGSLIVLSYGGIKVLRGEMTAGMFVVFFPYIRMLYGPIRSVTAFYSIIQRALASVERVFEVLDTEPEIKDKADAIELPIIRGDVEFRSVCFSYTESMEVLKDVSFRVYPGQMVAFVGPSGAGKTTAVNLVPRFYDPTSGDIFIDGCNIKDVKLDSLRKQMGIVLQEPFLFNDTVKASIGYGKLGSTDEEITEAAKAANAHDFIRELPQGYDTLIGERGVKLSGGQRQRISIARAILANPRILILDEATSSVDTETEMLIQNAIQRLVRDRTTFVIAHRLSTVHHADLIVVLDKGCVVEMGKHDELVAKGGLYSRLHKMQFRSPRDVIETEQKSELSSPTRKNDTKLDKISEEELKLPDDWS
jgi:subfamily B ATP-binding cassette protein MsbA